MGGFLTAAPRIEVRVVEDGYGKISIGGDVQLGKFWLLEDKTVTLALTKDRKTWVRSQFPVLTAAKGPGVLELTLESGDVVGIELRNCGCGMGLVASARVIDDRHKIVRVPRPDWLEDL